MHYITDDIKTKTKIHDRYDKKCLSKIDPYFLAFLVIGFSGPD